METSVNQQNDLTLTRKWLFISLISLAVVALFGTTMRTKILFDIPFLTQKFLIHAHSHFAFSGWVTHVLFIGLYLMIRSKIEQKRRTLYHWMIGINLFTAVGMLVWFTIQGYKAISITFSTLSIFAVVFYTIVFVNDIRKITFEHHGKKWAVAGLILNIISSLGPFYMAYLMISHSRDIVLRNSAIYYYLHVQYNGWFLFGCIALIMALIPNLPKFSWHFKLLIITILPAYILSILSLNIPTWLIVIGGICGFIQLAVWIDMIRVAFPIIKNYSQKNSRLVKNLFFIATFAITLKFILQSMSIIPSLSHLIFGMRPVIIGYLHLVLLAGYSLFLLGFLVMKGYVVVNSTARIFINIFIFGVILNEVALAVQGLGAFYYLTIPYVNETLLLAASILFLGASGLVISQIKKKDKEEKIVLQ